MRQPRGVELFYLLGGIACFIQDGVGVLTRLHRCRAL